MLLHSIKKITNSINAFLKFGFESNNTLKSIFLFVSAIVFLFLIDSIIGSHNHKISIIEYWHLQYLNTTRYNITIYGLFFFSTIVAIFIKDQNVNNKLLLSEKRRSEELLLNILPFEVSEELKAKGSSDAKLINEVTVLFTDFKGFTQLSEHLTPNALVAEINECFSAFDLIMQSNGVEKIKTIGDAYMAAGGMPIPNHTHANDVIKAAIEIQKYMERHKTEKIAKNELYFEIRIGVHTGPVVAGIVGVKKFQYDIWGDTVNIASRMESSGEVGMVNISQSTYELVKDKFKCNYRGEIQAKNKGLLSMYFVE